MISPYFIKFGGQALKFCTSAFHFSTIKPKFEFYTPNVVQIIFLIEPPLCVVIRLSAFSWYFTDFRGLGARDLGSNISKTPPPPIWLNNI